MLIPVPPAAELLGIRPKTVYAMIERGEIPPGVVVRIGRLIRINQERLQEWIGRGGSAAPAGIAG